MVYGEAGGAAELVLVRPVLTGLQIPPPFVLLTTPSKYVPAYRVVGVAESIARVQIIGEG